MLSKYKAVIFDFDDTLVHTIEPIWRQHKYVAKKYYDIDLTDETLRKYYGMPFEDMLYELYGRADTIENMKKNNGAEYDERFYKSLQDGAHKLVQKLLFAGKQVGILTASNKEHMDFDLARLDVPHEKFTFVQTSDDTDIHKPDPQVFEPTFAHLAELGITKLETVYIGDAIRDYVPARDAGIDFIGVTNGMTSVAEFQAEGASVVTGLSELFI